MTERFLYTRLTNLKHDYGVYVRPSTPADPLIKAVSSDLISSRRKLLFLYHDGNNTFFGVRERLSIEDERTRPILNFTGYRATSPISVPFFEDIQSRLEQITNEALQCHTALDADPKCGSTLTSSPIQFPRGNPQSGLDWDEAVSRLSSGRPTPFLLMFSDTGASVPIPARVSLNNDTAVKPEKRRSAEPPPRHPTPPIADNFERAREDEGDRHVPMERDVDFPDHDQSDRLGSLPPRKPNLPVDDLSDSIFNPFALGSRISASLKDAGRQLSRLSPFSSKKDKGQDWEP